jgi:hypothetical protein
LYRIRRMSVGGFQNNGQVLRFCPSSHFLLVRCLPPLYHPLCRSYPPIRFITRCVAPIRPFACPVHSSFSFLLPRPAVPASTV